MHALRGIKVADFGQFIAGPFCAGLLAGFGADVVRVERPSGNLDRALLPLDPDRIGDGALYQQVNRGKRSVALEVANEAARPTVERFIAWADVVVANIPPRALQALGLDWDTVSKVNPRASLVTCTAYESEGPRAALTGFDGIGQAMSGAMHMTGKDGEPRRAYAQYVDFSTASLSAFGVTMALLQRATTGRGQHIDTSLMRTAMTLMNATLIEEAALEIGREGTGNRAQMVGPADIFATSDGYILVQAIGTGMFRRVARLIGRDDWLEDPALATDALRGDERERLSAAVADWTKTRSTEACLEALRGANVPSSAVLKPADTLKDPAMRNPAWFDWMMVGGASREVPLSRPPFAMSDQDSPPLSAAPILGADTRAVLAEVGVPAAEIEALIRSGVAMQAAD